MVCHHRFRWIEYRFYSSHYWSHARFTADGEHPGYISPKEKLVFDRHRPAHFRVFSVRAAEPVPGLVRDDPTRG